MTVPIQDLLLSVFLVFCRLSFCLMVAPGVSNQNIPARARLLIALACTCALAPLLVERIIPSVSDADLVRIVRLAAGECLVGLLIGTCGRIFFLALEFAGTAATSFLGFSTMPGVPVDDLEQASSLTALINMGALVLVFVSNLHVELVRGVLSSYRVIELSTEFPSTEVTLRQLTSVLAEAFKLSLKLMSPFLVYSVVANLLFGLMNKMLPQIPVYFISGPFIIAGGLALCALIVPEMLSVFVSVYNLWLVTGSP